MPILPKRQHLITKVRASIKSKKLLSGSGYFLYSDGKNLEKNIFMKRIETDSSRLVTTGNARVGDTTSFTLSSRITSYNVCYTKLLRIIFIIFYFCLSLESGQPPSDPWLTCEWSNGRSKNGFLKHQK